MSWRVWIEWKSISGSKKNSKVSQVAKAILVPELYLDELVEDIHANGPVGYSRISLTSDQDSEPPRNCRQNNNKTSLLAGEGEEKTIESCIFDTTKGKPETCHAAAAAAAADDDDDDDDNGNNGGVAAVEFYCWCLQRSMCYCRARFLFRRRFFFFAFEQ